MPCILQCWAVAHHSPKAAGQGLRQTLMTVLDNRRPCAAAVQALVVHPLWLASLWQQPAVMCSDRPGQKTQDPGIICLWTAKMLQTYTAVWGQQRRT